VKIAALPLTAPHPTIPTGAVTEEIEALIDSLLDLGLQWVEPENIRGHLAALIRAHRGR
jgi:hypothetical protein